MNAELAIVATLTAPAALLGPLCLAGHLLARRHDAALAAAFRPQTAAPPPSGDGEPAPLPAPEELATVLAFPADRRDRAA